MDRPRYSQGDQVRVRDAYPIGHCRTPFYIRGLTGKVERCCGHFANPEELAYRRDGKPEIPLYRVRLLMSSMWPDYAGTGQDTLEVEVFEHWLEDL
ncbi:SH3-like domain-containing protein [uncultured Ruegeria sp.]|uniref:SH3-like domain-containing protein n=1 Tax=uncultured Ruegeria sp. TaxID=259304 RepID=UPI002613B76A|nr:SH3-like domain-containing protein [uncultured Ruegeria sp.]